jgi:hypothetical protein
MNSFIGGIRAVWQKQVHIVFKTCSHNPMHGPTRRDEATIFFWLHPTSDLYDHDLKCFSGEVVLFYHV